MLASSGHNKGLLSVIEVFILSVFLYQLYQQLDIGNYTASLQVLKTCNWNSTTTHNTSTAAAAKRSTPHRPQPYMLIEQTHKLSPAETEANDAGGCCEAKKNTHVKLQLPRMTLREG